MTGPGRRAWLFAGQGAQRRRMGAEYVTELSDHWELAEAILGFSVRAACTDDPAGRLRDTRYLQPVMFVLNAVAGLVRAKREPPPDFLAGHSLGELNALFAAGCLDFETAVRLVGHRGELMGLAAGGAMMAVVGPAPERITAAVAASGIPDVDVANYNSSSQVVLSCRQSAVPTVIEAVQRVDGARCVPLDVSAAFHSRFMAEAAAQFAEHLAGLRFDAPRIPVVSNVTAAPYRADGVAELLGRQVREPVRWRQSMGYLIAQGVTEAVEIGPGRVLTGFWESARKEFRAPPGTAENGARPVAAGPVGSPARRAGPEVLGSAEFRRTYGTRLAYASGAMFRGIASPELVTRMARAGLFGFFGSGGLTLAEIERAITTIRADAGPDARFGMNLLHELDDPAHERATVALYLRADVRFVEAAAYPAVTDPLVWFRYSGAHHDAHGVPVTTRYVLAKVSRPEVAEAFARPAAGAAVARLLAAGLLTDEEAAVARRLPVGSDICVEADSAGHTDGGVALTLVPRIARLCADATHRYGYPAGIRLGVSGGLGSPEAVAAAFVLGADFVVTGSVNQCTPEAGTSDLVKAMLADLDVQDTAYAPAGDMFELGARVQVVKKGTLFAPRGNRLYQLYRHYGGLDELDGRTRRSLEETCFRRSLAEVWEQTRAHHAAAGRTDLVDRGLRDPKHRMGQVFRWYFAHSTRVALAGDLAERVNFQIHCGPAMGAFNHAVRGTELADWPDRHVDLVAKRLMAGAAEVLQR